MLPQARHHVLCTPHPCSGVAHQYQTVCTARLLPCFHFTHALPRPAAGGGHADAEHAGVQPGAGVGGHPALPRGGAVQVSWRCAGAELVQAQCCGAIPDYPASGSCHGYSTGYFGTGAKRWLPPALYTLRMHADTQRISLLLLGAQCLQAAGGGAHAALRRAGPG